MSLKPISFFTPVKYEHQPTTFRQKMTEIVDVYFSLKGRVAIVVPGQNQNGSEGVKLQAGQHILWHSILKTISYAVPLLNLLVMAQFPGIMVARRMLHFQVILSCLPIFMLIAKIVLRSTAHFHLYQQANREDVKAPDSEKKDHPQGPPPLKKPNLETGNTSPTKAPTESIPEPRLIEPLFSTEKLALQYEQGKVFDTCIVNGERFALIDARSLQALASKSAGNITLNLPNHHLIILDPVVTHTLTLEGKSVTVITSLTIAGDLSIKVPRNVGKIIFYGSQVNVQGNAAIVAKDWIQKGYRIETTQIQQNGRVQDEVIDYLAVVKSLFQKGVTDRSSTTTALALLKAGHEILFSENQEISRSDIFSLWGIPL